MIFANFILTYTFDTYEKKVRHKSLVDFFAPPTPTGQHKSHPDNSNF